MPVPVLRRSRTHAVQAEPSVDVGDQVRVGEIDARVENGNADSGAGKTRIVSVWLGWMVGTDSLDPGG